MIEEEGHWGVERERSAWEEGECGGLKCIIIYCVWSYSQR
jgi:hypothetical protein